MCWMRKVVNIKPYENWTRNNMRKVVNIKPYANWTMETVLRQRSLAFKSFSNAQERYWHLHTMPKNKMQHDCACYMKHINNVAIQSNGNNVQHASMAKSSQQPLRVPHSPFLPAHHWDLWRDVQRRLLTKLEAAHIFEVRINAFRPTVHLLKCSEVM